MLLKFFNSTFLQYSPKRIGFKNRKASSSQEKQNVLSTPCERVSRRASSSKSQEKQNVYRGQGGKIYLFLFSLIEDTRCKTCGCPNKVLEEKVDGVTRIYQFIAVYSFLFAWTWPLGFICSKALRLIAQEAASKAKRI